jgi:hypothetical protein
LDCRFGTQNAFFTGDFMSDFEYDKGAVNETNSTDMGVILPIGWTNDGSGQRDVKFVSKPERVAVRIPADPCYTECKNGLIEAFSAVDQRLP